MWPLSQGCSEPDSAIQCQTNYCEVGMQITVIHWIITEALIQVIHWNITEILIQVIDWIITETIIPSDLLLKPSFKWFIESLLKPSMWKFCKYVLTLPKCGSYTITMHIPHQWLWWNVWASKTSFLAYHTALPCHHVTFFLCSPKLKHLKGHNFGTAEKAHPVLMRIFKSHSHSKSWATHFDHIKPVLFFLNKIILRISFWLLLWSTS